MARPRKQIDRELFTRLCYMQCSLKEICYVLNVTNKTLEKWAREEFGKGAFEKQREVGKIALRRIQWRHAAKSPQMAIWLGKQYLGQKDKTQTEITERTDLDPISQALKELCSSTTENG